MKKYIAVCLILFLLSSVSVVSAAQINSKVVSPLTKQNMIINLNSGDKFSGSLSIIGGSENDVDFKIADPQGNIILDLGRVSVERSFEFTAQQSGSYSMQVDNSFSSLSSKNVSLTYDVEAQLFGIAVSSWITIGIVVLVIIIIVVVLEMTIKSLRKRRKMPSNSIE